MKRLPVYAVLLVLLAALIWLGGQSFPSDSSGGDSASISRYEADFRVDEDGDLHATETLTVEFPSFANRHGIFRFFDHRDPNADFLRRKPHDISVTRGGREEDFELLSEGAGRYTNVKIGSASRTVSGTQVYVIRYVVDDVLLPLDGGERSRFYWDLIPSGWQMDIAESRLSVSLPADAEGVDCHVGAGERGGCTAQGAGTSTLTVETGALQDHTPVTIDTGLPLATPKPAEQSLWPTYLDGIFGRSLGLVVLALLLGGLAAVAGYKVSHSTREKRPGFPLLYAPPEGIGPAQAVYVLNEKLDNRAFVGSLMLAAEHDVIDFTPQGNAWTIAPKVRGNGALDPITAQIVTELGADHRSFAFSSDDVKAGMKLQSVLSSYESSTRSWASRANVMTPSGLAGLGGFVLIGAVLAAGWLAIAKPLDASIWAIVPGLFAVFGFEIAGHGAGTRRTPEGRDLWSRVGGFHRILSTPSAEARFDFAGRKDLYTAYLPWAVAFGCADSWAKKYRVEVGEEPPAPSYWGSGYHGVHTGALVSQMVDSFDATVDSAVSSYEATQRSSSSGGGGGGGFGGGGGGGGGGGSW